MSKQQIITDILQNALSPTFLEVINESEQHSGHSGYSDGESHYRVKISSDKLTGSRLTKHRAIYSLLQDIDYHALAIEV